ncbi:MAG: anthranilate synthase component I family protein, partial [Myxococcota bacterium]
LRQSTRLVVSQRTEGDLDAAYDAALQRLRTLHRRLRTPGAPLPTLPLRPRATMTLPPSSFSKDDFLRAVERCKEHIRSGDIFQAVLSQRFEVRAEVNPFTAYRALRVVNPSPYMFHLRLGERSVSGASPETLVRVEDGVATLRPIAGTRPRGSTRAEDAAHEASLLADPKERAEHVMLIDLGRNDLGRISTAGGVSITEAMVVERYSHVMHMTSNLEGRVREGLNAFDVIASTFPAGTLSGAPKVRAMQILAELEPVSRGLYGGAVGYIGFDGSTDLAIAIRTAEFRQGRASLQAGAGIVEASVPEREWEETVHKARAGLTALSMAAEATEPA